MTTVPVPPDFDLAGHLLAKAEKGRPDSYYRLARMVARTLTSRRLKRRRKWCNLAKSLAANPGVEPRLISQALNWLSLKPEVSSPL